MANKKNLFYIFVLFFLLATSGILNLRFKKPNFTISQQESALNIDNKLLLVFDLGQKRLISNLLWISTLIESDLEHYKSKDLNSWMYLRFKTIASIDPQFLRNYQFGGKYLSIIKDDQAGAESLFKQGLNFYPFDYDLNYYLGSLYALDTHEYKKAYFYYNKIKDNPRAPQNIESVLIKLQHMYKRDLLLTFELLENLKNDIADSNKKLKEKINRELYNLKAQIDLKCLNETNNKCSKIDYFGNSYILTPKGTYKTKLKVREYEFYQNK